MGPERSLVGRVKCYVSDSQQIHGGPGEGPGMQAEVVLSEERSSREHGQHVVEPGPDTSEVKLPLRIQVPKRISQAQLQVGGAQERGAARRVEVGGSDGSVGASGAGHGALGRQRGRRLQTGRPGQGHLGHG